MQIVGVLMRRLINVVIMVIDRSNTLMIKKEVNSVPLHRMFVVKQLFSKSDQG